MQKRESIFLFTALFYTLYIIFPLFGDLIALPAWLPSMLTAAVIYALYPKVLASKIMKWFLVYAVVLGLYVIIGKPLTIGIGTVADSKKIFIEFAYILPAIGIFLIFDYLKDYKLAKKYVIWSTIILYVSFIVVVPLMLRFNSLRDALVLQDETITITISGLPGYSLMHAYTLLVPVACFAVELSSGMKKILSVFALLILCFVIYSTLVTTSMVIAIAVIILAFTNVGNHESTYWTNIVLLLVVVWLLYEVGFFLWFIDIIYPFFEDTVVQPKLDDFRESMLSGGLQGGSIMDRHELHARSIDAFLANPIFGNPSVGGHSSILDRFGGLGLLGGIPFVMMFVSFYKIVRRWFFLPKTRFFFILGFFAGLTFLYEKGLWGSESWLMYLVLMPLGILVFEQQRKNGKFIA